MSFYSTITFLLDPLSVFFLLVILLVSIPSAVYSIGYLRNHYSPNKIRLAWVLLAAFVLSMAGVVTANNAFIFLIAWEMMSLISYFLVVFDHTQEKSVTAGIIYLVMTHIGTAFIIVAFLILYNFGHSFDFAAFKSAGQTMPANLKHIVFLLLLVGFGTKAGIVPFHIWLPYAHPQAPSHVSSIMSGVMIKTAIYGMLRFIIFLLGVESAWWGNLVLVLALLSCLVGVIYALMEHDLKKLLAYHSVENIGIILLGVGAAMVFLKLNLPVLAVIALCAGLYHLMNHALFKGLLFLCAGSVYNATGTRNIEKLGGLIKLMPYTAAAFLVGSLAISAIPPFNGFVSEWLTLQAFFLGAMNSISGEYKVFFSVCASLLALTGGLAAACFVKAFGITFLAMPRSKNAAEAKESSFSMKAAFIFMMAAIVLSGLAAAPILKALTGIAGSVLSIETAGISLSLNNFALAVPQNSGAFLSTPLVALAFITVAGICVLAVYLWAGRRKAVKSNTWDCGYYQLDARTEYTATAFSKPFRIAFNFFLLPYTKTEKIRESFYHVKSFKYEVFTTPVFRQYAYDPIVAFILLSAKRVRRIQMGSIHFYLAYIWITIILLLLLFH
ncbi:MAG TPA: proton-conducting transporter membrane subunit [Planctomycetota bacterium]|nr:proton-conducting transporter membrane subunit [Planctomycetota bacterium]